MRLRFTIRDLLWLTVVAALSAGWWLNRSKLASVESDRKNLETKLRQVESKEKAVESVYIGLERIVEELAGKPGYEELKRRLDEYNATAATAD
jgi:hypothetical protein